MLGQHIRELNPDIGNHADPQIASHLATLAAWRRRSWAEQRLALAGDDPAFMPTIEPARGRTRLGLFCPCLGLGGGEAWQLALLQSIDPAAVVWRGAVVTEGRQSVAPPMLEALETRIPVGFGLNAARALARACDVIISWSVLDYDELFRGIEARPRVALACHFPGERPWTAGAEQLLRRVDRLVAVSELAIDSLPVPLRGSAEVIWNAVDAGRLLATTPAAATRARWGVPPGAKVAGYLGRLAPEKDPAAMLRLAAALPRPWHVVLVGDGRERAALGEEVDRLGLDWVRFVPGTADVGDVLAAFDSLVVPSRFESFGLTMAEGFWAGVPVVATRSGLVKLVPGLAREIGFVPSGADLAEAVLLDHEVDRVAARDRVARAQRFAHDRLSLARFGADWTRLVRDLHSPHPKIEPREESCPMTAVA